VSAVFRAFGAAVLLTVASGATTPAAAQEVGRLTEGQQTWRFEREEHQRRRPSWLELIEHHGRDRVDRAIRVDHLIHQGRCREARDLANAEGDRNMALRARQLCPGNTGAVTPRGRRMRGEG
jgi:hypothetical protein